MNERISGENSMLRRLISDLSRKDNKLESFYKSLYEENLKKSGGVKLTNKKLEEESERLKEKMKGLVSDKY
jgi:hypothetical protein